MKPVIEVENLKVVLQNKAKKQTLVENVHFHVHRGECLGILGESGSGKSMSVKSVLGLLDHNFQISGSATFGEKNLLSENKEEMRRLRGKKIAMVLQNPMTCFDPLYRIEKQMDETFLAHTEWTKAERYQQALSTLEKMRIENGEEVLEKYPHQISGGMLQRIMIGIALALKPELIIADEPTTAIDGITQYEILQEFCRIKQEENTAIIFISHDLSAIAKVADRVLVMNNGHIVDEGSFTHILENAQDPYTKLLVEKRRAVMKRYRSFIGRECIAKC